MAYSVHVCARDAWCMNINRDYNEEVFLNIHNEKIFFVIHHTCGIFHLFVCKGRAVRDVNRDECA